MGLILMVLLIAVIIPYGILYFFTSKSSEPNVYRPDPLRSNRAIDSLRSYGTSSDRGILAPNLPSGEKYYISTSDRGLVIGPPGTGKTSFLINQIYEWTNTGNSFVCLDVKPEIADLTKDVLVAKGYKIIIYNPIDVVDSYDFLQDLSSPEAVGELANSLIPNDNSGDNLVFNQTASDLLDALLNHVKALHEDRVSKNKGKEYDPPSLPQVYDLLTKYDNTKALFNDLKHSKSLLTRQIINSLSLTAENERLLGSIYATFNANLRFLRYESVRESLSGGGFSLKELLQPKTALFLQFDEVYNNVTGHLFSVFVGHLLKFLILNHKDREPVFCLLDEIGNAGIINDLTGKLNTIRSRKIPTWMYWQSVEQMQKYGKKTDEGANIIFGACDFQMCFRLNDTATATLFSERIGTHLVDSISVNVDDGNNSSQTHSKLREAVIFPHELQQLGNSQVISIYRSSAWYGVAEPYWREPSKEQKPKEQDSREELERLKLQCISYLKTGYKVGKKYTILASIQALKGFKIVRNKVKGMRDARRN